MFKISTPDIKVRHHHLSECRRYALQAIEDKYLHSFYSSLDAPDYSLLEKAFMDCYFAPVIAYV
ncbi:hypothetical protein [Flavihumibacter sp. UBA7668]|uniref:hypothetical protein n=1 Tax=Flavihumibacter sp. UBA7668 TaxID=1946542 RepID=UPI0025BDC487|nr:hypothetical protein [Flavihumibacter sp. UBA7668]